MTIRIRAEGNDNNAIFISELLGIPIVHPEIDAPNKATIINFSNIRYKPFKPKPHTIYNAPAALSFVTDKPSVFEIAVGHNNLVPRATFNLTTAKKWLKGGEELICFNKYNKAITKVKGRGELSELNSQDISFYSQVIPCKREYQVLFCGHESRGILPLIKDKNTQPNAIKTEKNGYYYQKGAVAIPGSIEDKIEQVIRNNQYWVNMHFGVVNVMRTQRDDIVLLNIKGIGDAHKLFLPAIIKQIVKVVR